MARNSHLQDRPSGQPNDLDRLGRQVDHFLAREDIGLTLGGEPTFVAMARETGPEWTFAPLGKDKLRRGLRLLLRLRRAWQPDSLVLRGVGKSYPGEDLPRWALTALWRRDGVPLWAGVGEPDLPVSGKEDRGSARGFLELLALLLGLPSGYVMAAGEEDGPIVGEVLPLLRASGSGDWRTCAWSLETTPLPLLPLPASLGLRLPLHRLPDPGSDGLLEEWLDPPDNQDLPPLSTPEDPAPPAAANSIRVALCVSEQGGCLRVFLPPLGAATSFVQLVQAVATASGLVGRKVRLEGFLPPHDPLLPRLTVTPDPGVLEVNLPPMRCWEEIVARSGTLYREAQSCGLKPWRYLADGRRVGTGGGSHLTLGSDWPGESLWFRRPDLLASLLNYWHNHPGLTHAFGGLFTGPTSQAPRLDQIWPYGLAEVELALDRLAARPPPSPELIDALLRPLLRDRTGNAHRSEFCIDKLYPRDLPWQRWGLVEWRGAEMPPEPGLWPVLALLLRCMVVFFWRQPYRASLTDWGEALYDRFALPAFIAQDLETVVADLTRSGLPFNSRWLEPFLAFRFPVLGRISIPEAELELRQALEIWPVVETEQAGQTSSRPVDNSCERLQVALKSVHPENYGILCNRILLPLAAVAADCHALGLRFKVRTDGDAHHPLLPCQLPLTFSLVDLRKRRLLGQGVFSYPSPTDAGGPALPSSGESTPGGNGESFLRAMAPPDRDKVTWRLPRGRSPKTPLTLDLLRCCVDRRDSGRR